MLSLADAEVIDLSIGIEPGTVSEPTPASVEYFDHEEGAETLAETLREMGIEDIEGEDFPDGVGLAWEEVTAITHTGTHMDAPWHYGREVDGEPARTIDEIPIEWGCGDAVVLDFTWMDAGEEIGVDDIEAQLADLDHALSTGEIAAELERLPVRVFETEIRAARAGAFFQPLFECTDTLVQ